MSIIIYMHAKQIKAHTKTHMIRISIEQARESAR